MRVILLLIAALALLFVAGFGGLRGFEQFGAAENMAGVTDPATAIGGAIGDLVGQDNAVADALSAFTSGAEDTVSALRRGAVGMMGTALMALFVLLFAMGNKRFGVGATGVLAIGAGVASWIFNPEIDLGPLEGLSQKLIDLEITQKLIDLGPMSDTSPKTLALILGGVTLVGVFVALLASPGRSADDA